MDTEGPCFAGEKKKIRAHQNYTKEGSEMPYCMTVNWYLSGETIRQVFPKHLVSTSPVTEIYPKKK